MHELREFPDPLRILVVDDDADLRLTVCEYLKSLNLDVTPARDGTEAIGLLRNSQVDFDIIFSDLMMPSGPNGLEVLKTAKQEFPFCRVVIMTGYSCFETALESIRLGAFDYLAKPFKLVEVEILVDRIREYQSLLADNRRLSQQLLSLADQLQTMNTKLERIDISVCRMSANLERIVQTSKS